MAVNWDQLNQPGAFERAFDSGFQLAEYGRQRREQTDQRNALSAYAIDPSEGNFNALAQHLPQVAMQQRASREAAAQRQQQAGYEGIQQFRPVLEQAMQSPQAWQQARTALAQSGHDISDVPEQFDPNWAQGQLMILNAADDGSLPGIVQEFQAAGIDVDTPTGKQALRDALEGKYGSEYTDQEGNVRRRRLFNLPPVDGGQQTQAPQMAGVPSGSPLSQPAPQQAQPQQQPPIFPAGEWQTYSRAIPAPALAAIEERDRPVIVNSQGAQVQTDVINGQIAYRVNGVWYDNPEGQ
jgi:hypothetical protein